MSIIWVPNMSFAKPKGHAYLFCPMKSDDTMQSLFFIIPFWDRLNLISAFIVPLIFLYPVLFLFCICRVIWEFISPNPYYSLFGSKMSTFCVQTGLYRFLFRHQQSLFPTKVSYKFIPIFHLFQYRGSLLHPPYADNTFFKNSVPRKKTEIFR